MTVNYSSGRKTKKLSEDLFKLGKALARGSNAKTIANAILSSSELKQSIEDSICKTICDEAKTLCSLKSKSYLRTPTKESMVNFSWNIAREEIQNKAPLLYKVLQAFANPASTKCQSKASSSNKYPGICLAAGILLKLRDPAMSLIPYIMSLMMKVSGLKKRYKLAEFITILQ